MKRFRYSCIAVLLAYLLLLTLCAKREPAVAMIDGRAITLAEFKEYFAKRKSSGELASATMDELKAILDDLILKQMKINAGYDMGLDKDSAVVAVTDGIMRHHLLGRLFQSEIMDRVIPMANHKSLYYSTALPDLKYGSLHSGFHSSEYLPNYGYFVKYPQMNKSRDG